MAIAVVVVVDPGRSQTLDYYWHPCSPNWGSDSADKEGIVVVVVVVVVVVQKHCKSWDWISRQSCCCWFVNPHESGVDCWGDDYSGDDKEEEGSWTDQAVVSLVMLVAAADPKEEALHYLGPCWWLLQVVPDVADCLHWLNYYLLPKRNPPFLYVPEGCR